MSEVTLTIGGRHYTVACANGEEAHITRLGQVIDGKLAQLGSALGPNESRNFLFTSLLLADDLHEKVKETEGLQPTEVERMRAELEALKAQHAASGEELRAAIAERDRLQGEIDSRGGEHESLRDELDALRAAKQRGDSELAEARNQASRMASELEELRNARPAGADFLALHADPELAPALERFAEMLESCAAKLEGKASAA